MQSSGTVADSALITCREGSALVIALGVRQFSRRVCRAVGEPTSAPTSVRGGCARGQRRSRVLSWDDGLRASPPLELRTICHPGGGFWDGHSGVLRTARLVCHCLLLEVEDGLVLVDTGLGTADLAQPRRRLGPMWLLYSRPLIDPGQTALAQVRRLGFAAADVRHIVLTHLDLDHAGGLSDFPTAQVHVLDVEYTQRNTAANQDGEASLPPTAVGTSTASR